MKKWRVFGRNTFKTPFKISDALINEARIVYVVRGKTRLYSANQYTELESGDVLVMKTDNFINNWQENESGELSQVIVFQMNAEFLQHIYQNQLPDWFTADDIEESNAVEKALPNPMLSTFFENIQHYLDNPDFLTEEVIQIKVKELISVLVQTDTTGGMKRIFGNLFKASEYEFQEIIHKNLFEDLNIEDLAFFTGMSLSSFKRKFAAVYGTSPNKYIVSKRLEKAQTLLATTDLHISEIAYDCGFGDVSYFSKTFRKYYNISPSDIRKNGLN